MTQSATCPSAKPWPFRLVGVSIGVAALLTTLMGCALIGSDGQSKESADAALLAIPGVSDASVNTRSIRSGFQVETTTTVKISLQTGFEVPRPDVLVNYLLAAAWSTETKEANSTIVVIVSGHPQISVLDALDAGEWTRKSGNPQFAERASVSADEVKGRFGDWPGEVPEMPNGLIVGPTPEPTP